MTAPVSPVSPLPAPVPALPPVPAPPPPAPVAVQPAPAPAQPAPVMPAPVKPAPVMPAPVKPAPAPVAKPEPAKAAPPPPPPGQAAGRIALDTVDSPWVKDPSFADKGRPIGGERYMVFGDLRRFYLKGFDVAKTADGQPGLSFAKGEIPIDVKGLPPGIDGLWAPEIVVRGDRVVLLYSAGKMPPGGLDWPSFRLRTAEVSLADFQAAAKAGQPVPFQDKGVMFPDQTTFGGDSRFAMIDPSYYVGADGAAYVTYTVVKHGIPGERSHEEFIRSRRVDPDHPEVAVGADTAMLDGWAGGRHDGVVEAQDVIDADGKTLLFVSSRAGDKDQKVYVAAIGSELGRVPEEALKPVLTPGGDDWSAKAIGSTGAAVLDGTLFVVHQGLDNAGKFSLGFRSLPSPV